MIELAKYARKCPFHPLLWGALFVLLWYRNVQDFAGPGVLVLFLSGGLGACLLLVILLRWIIKDYLKTSLVSSLVILFLCFFLDFRGEFQRMVWGSALAGLARFRVFFPGLLVLLGCCARWVLRTRRDLRSLHSYARVTSLLTVSVTVLQILFHKPVPPPQHESGSTHPAFVEAAKLRPRLPDIYYIILDSHTSVEGLRRFWNYDPRDFTAQLRRRGFHIADNAHSNYPLTACSMAAALTMDYPPGIASSSPIEQTIMMQHLIQRSEVIQILTDLGYRIENYSLFELGDHRRYYTYFAEPGSFRSLFQRTLPGFVGTELVGTMQLRKTNLGIMAKLRNFPAPSGDRKPLFVYAHVMMPHSPYLFDRHGNKVVRNPSIWDQAAYLEQLRFVDELALKTIDALLSQYPSPPIILLQGDHGFRLLPGPAQELESTSILSAYLLPGGGDQLLYASMTPVNLFRIIFNFYFGADYPRLEDRTITFRPPQAREGSRAIPD